ncbi:ABC transporter ATP-binding protein [Acuticoccus sp.]|uniref:ABC transporter ATP-binding protein n=1 Tax=Acuticoccus sp. TaxID=1904378 RepID=UPI003B51C1C9
MSEALLATQGLTRTFGGLVAVSDVTLTVQSREIVGLIGPNGAGKTTLFNLLVGLTKPTRGTVELEGRSVVGRKPHAIAARGMTKTFQNVALFMDSSVLDNVVTGALLRHPLAEARRAAHAALDRVGLDAVAHRPAGDLSFPERARVEVARALATEPKILLLDEVMAALTPMEMEGVIALVRDLREREGLTFIVVEHHMKAVMALCERILVLNFGQLIAEGTPAEVSRNETVIDAYLGSEFRRALHGPGAVAEPAP